jgi:hypothetical protein
MAAKIQPHPIYASYGDTGFDTLRMDASTHTLQTIEYEHHEIHAGSAYFAIRSELVDSAGDVEVRFAQPDTTKYAHMTIEVDSALAATIELWAATTKTHEAGNAITPLNRNFNSTNTSGLTICHTPGGAQAGTANLTQYVGAASVSGKVNEGGGASSRHEFILKRNTAYYIKATSRADGNAISIILDWYEHTDKS